MDSTSSSTSSSPILALDPVAMTIPLALPPRRSEVDMIGHPRIVIRHPGYRRKKAYSLLFDSPSYDYVDDPSSKVRTWGVHYATIIVACGIFVSNTFDDVYLSRDPYGKEKVTVARDAILEAGDYWLQLRGREPPPDTPSLSSSPTTTSTSCTDEYYKYPIVPTFSDWRFPHDKLPEEWQQARQLSTYSSATPKRCFITDLRIGLEQGHVIPSAQKWWFVENDMARYSHSLSDTVRINQPDNLAILMGNILTAFENRAFVIIPKPSDTPSLLSPRPHKFAAHVISTTVEGMDLASSYHNVSIHDEYIRSICPEFLLARFAWALFPYLQSFLFEHKDERQLSVIEKPGSPHTNLWMNSDECILYQVRRGASPSELHQWRQGLGEADRWTSTHGSRKRRGGPSSENGEQSIEDRTNEEDDGYGENDEYKRRCVSRERSSHDDNWEDWEEGQRGRPRHRRMSSSSSPIRH
ncbi:hypothetical protein F4808DRAFT_219605 [Astrocystis sublimbata]|nr:hypothetical protein F4808DRAFT_219605 [Astrocystis sublimbata]